MKKRISSVLCRAVLLLSITALPACSSIGDFTDAPKDINKNITEIKMTGENTGYGLDQGAVVITYDAGATWVPVPHSGALKENYEKNAIGFYISSEITAFAYGGKRRRSGHRNDIEGQREKLEQRCAS